jgi:hypothetical protein
MEKLKKNQSAITQIEVTFREIDRLFDTLSDGTGVPSYRIAAIDRNGKPRVIVHDPFSALMHSPSFSDENGDPIRDEMYEMPGVYRSIRSTEAPHFLWHTFARWKSRPIDNKYVYVWAADSKTGSGIRLAYELYFSGGKFRFIDVKSVDRRPKGTAQEKLVLDLISFKDAQEKQVFYFFLLARFQIPVKRLEEIKKDIPTRSAHLWDEFHLDLDTKSMKAVQVDKLKRGNKDLPPKVSFCVHLLDPFREALSRSERYKNALHRWQESQKAMSGDTLYLLAKRIESLSERDESLKEHLAYSFHDYLNTAEAESRRRYFVMASMAAELIRWIGKMEKREKFARKGFSSDTWLHDGKSMIPSKEDKGEDVFHNLYYQACFDYPDATNEVCSDVAEIIGAVMDELEQSPNGEAWLEELLKAGVEGKLPELESGATEFFFETKRKGNELMNKLGGKLLGRFAPSWVAHYRKDALKNLNNWFKAKYGVSLKETEAGLNRKTRRALESSERRALRRGRRAGITKLEITPASADALQFTSTSLQVLQAGIEVVNLYHALASLKEHADDPWAYLECMGSALDAYSALHETAEKLKFIESVEEVAEAGSWAKKFLKVGVFSAIIDVATGSHDMYESDTASGMIANGMRTVGSGLVLGGEVAEEHPLGWIATIAGLALQSGGSYLRDQTRAACVFLRHCRWGKGANTFDAIVATVKDENSYWYKGKLAALAANTKMQHKCLDELIYNYEPEMEFEGEDHDCYLKVKIKSKVAALGTGAKWDIKIELKKTNDAGFGASSPRTISFTPGEDFDDVDLTAGESYRVRIADASDGNWTIRFQAKVTSKVDVFGDSVHVVERECEGGFYFVPKLEERPAGGVPDETPRDAGVPDSPVDRDAGTPSGGTSP